MAAPADVIEERSLQERLGRVEELVRELEQLPDASARAAAEEVIATVLELHATALRRVLDIVATGGGDAGGRGGGAALLDRLAADPLVRDTLLLHGLHPVDLRTRVEQALESVRPYMRSHGGGVELVAVHGDVVGIRLEGHCKGCPSSAMTLRLAVEKAIHEAAPDVVSIEVVESAEPAPPAPPQFPVCPIPLATAGGR